MKKRLVKCTLLCAAIALIAMPLSAGGGQEKSGGADKQAAPKKTVLKFNSVLSSTDKTFGFWSDFCKDIENSSAGTLKVETYPSEALGKSIDMIQAMIKGSPVLQDCDTSHLSDLVPDYSVFGTPYLFKQPEDIEKAWKSDLGKKLGAQLEAKGLRIVTLVYFGTRHLISNKAVATRADTKNMKIRCAPTKMWNETAKVLGGNPTNTAWSEVYTALSQGVADAAESPLSLLYSAKLYESRKNISLTGHLVAVTCIAMSQKVYESLPPEGKKAIDTVGQSYPTKRIQLISGIEKEFRARLESEGVKFNEVDKTDFIKAAKDVPKNFPEWTPGLFDEALKAIQ